MRIECIEELEKANAVCILNYKNNYLQGGKAAGPCHQIIRTLAASLLQI